MADEDSAVTTAAFMLNNTSGGNGGAVATLVRASVQFVAGSALVSNAAEGSGGCAFLGGDPSSISELQSNLCSGRCVPPMCSGVCDLLLRDLCNQLPRKSRHDVPCDLELVAASSSSDIVIPDSDCRRRRSRVALTSPHCLQLMAYPSRDVELAWMAAPFTQLRPLP